MGVKQWFSRGAWTVTVALTLASGTALAAERSAARGGPAKAVEDSGNDFRHELDETSDEMGKLTEDKDVRNTATIDVSGLVLGDGINGQFVHSNSEKVSTVVGGNYSRASGVGGAITKFGAELGVDYFVLGRRNEGLRVGPRVVASLGVDTTGGSAGFGDVGAGGEVGYNFITAEGLTAGAAAGWDLVFSGRLGGNTTGDVSGNPYGKFNVGYSW
jgi:hypothetical protein